MVSPVVDRASLYMLPACLNLSVTQTVVKIQALRISFCDAVDKEKRFEIPAVTLNPACNPVRI